MAFYDELVTYARAHGLSRAAAEGYATLMAWGAEYDLPPAAIVSGLRSPQRVRELQREWDRVGRNGPNRLAVRPATNSAHVQGDAFDLENVPHRWIYGEWAPFAGLRWGGTFSTPDEPHFDTR